MLAGTVITVRKNVKMTLYEQNGKKYEIKIVEGVETIESETKPGPGWIRTTPETSKILKEISEDIQAYDKKLKKMLEEIEEEFKEELAYRRSLGEDI